MKEVQPIRNVADIERMKTALRDQGERNYFLFVLLLNTGLRVSDGLALKVRDVIGTHVDIIEKKTGKRKRHVISNGLRKDVDTFIEGKDLDSYLFKSTKSNGAISRVQAHRIISDTARSIGLEGVACHSIRKTFGYMFYQRTHDIALLMDIFGHSAPSITMRYIGLNQDIKDQATRDFYI